MNADPQQVRAEQHVTVGALIQRDAGILIDRWARRAVQEQPNAPRVHHQTLLDHLPNLLWEIGRSLAEADESGNGHHVQSARRHGEERWETGWSLEEVVRDYQILRLVMVDYLEEALDRPLRGREVMAMGLALDEAIAASVSRYTRHQEEAVRQGERDRAERDQQASEAYQRRQVEALKEAERRKDEFLALLGHELRNPLAPIRNALQVLRLRGAEPATLAWAEELLERQVEHLSRMLDDLLDVSRIGRGKMLLRREPLDLARVARGAVEDHRGILEGAGLTLQVELPAEPVWVAGDPTRLAQVVGNLLHNAAKFTDGGGRVTLRLAADPETRRALVTVSDTGIGIEPALLPSVFEMFTQADRSLHRSRGGLGLGLALVKGLVELHGGGVKAASAGTGQGAEFSFWLPLAQTPAEPAGPEPEEAAKRKALRVLVVDDNRDSADSLRLLLELQGLQAAAAYSGPGGLDAVRQFRPDVVLCDLQLPGMDGFAVARTLRGDPATAHVRLIALTGYGSPADQQRCLEAGYDRHLPKPVEPDELLRVITTPSPPRDPGGASVSQ